MALLAASMALALGVLYYGAMNAFIGTRIFRSAIRSDTGSLLVEYASAYSMWPGRIHVDKLYIRGRDSSVEWELSIDRCDFRVSPTDLLRRRFHASHVEGDGLALRVRLRHDSVSAEAMAGLPRMPGFLDPPRSDVGPPTAPVTDANYKLWSVFLEGVEASHVREVWIDTVRYAGDLKISGSWFFRPLRWLDVGPATVELRPLDVSFGDVEPWARGVTGTLEVEVHPTDLVATGGAAMVDQVSVRGDVRGEGELANPLNRVLTEAKVSLATARFTAHIEIDRGMILPPTHLATEPVGATVEADGCSFAADLGFDVVARERGFASTRVTATAVRVGKGRTLLAAAPRISVRADTRIVDLADVPTPGLGLDALAVDAPSVDLPSLAAWTSLVRLPEGLSVEAGAAHAALVVDLDMAGGDSRARVDVELKALVARFVGEAIAGDARLALRAVTRAGAIDVSGTTLTFHTDEGAPSTQWWGGAELTEATLRGVKAPHLRARVAVHAKDASPLAALLSSKTSIPKFLLDAVSTTDLQATGDIVATPSLVEAKAVRAHCAGLDGRFEYVLQRGAAAWALWLDLGLVRVSVYQDGGASEVALFDTESWFASRVARVQAIETGAN